MDLVQQRGLFVSLVRFFATVIIGALLVFGSASLGSAQTTYRYSRSLPPPKSMDPGLVREARNTLTLILYKQQHNLFDHRYLSEDEFNKLARQAALSAADAAVIAAQLKESASLLPVEHGIAEQLRGIVTPTISQLDTGLARLKAPTNVTDIYTLLEKNNDVSRGVARANIQLLKAVQPLAHEDVYDKRKERESALSLLNRQRLAWQNEVSRVKAGTATDSSEVEKRRTEYLKQFEEVKKQTIEVQRLTASQQNLQTAIQMHQEFDGAFQKLEAVSKGLKKINLLAGDGSALDQSVAFVDALDTLSSTALGHLTSMQRLSNEVLQRDKQYLHDTLLAERFTTDGGPTYLNEVLRRLDGEKADKEILDSMVSIAKKGQAITSTVKKYLPDVKAGGLLFYNAWEEHNKFNPHGDLQSANTQRAINYFSRLSELLLEAPNFLERRGIKIGGPVVEILKYAGHTAGMLPLLVNRYSDAVNQYQQFVTLPPDWRSPSGANAPFLKARHMFLHTIGLVAYADLGGDDQAKVYVEQNVGFGRSGWVTLTQEQFQEVLHAMSVFTTLTGRNPTQDEFLTLCESRGTGNQTFRTPTFHYFDLDPDSSYYFQMREMILSVGNLLGREHREVLDNPRYADRHGGNCLALCETWNAAVANIKNPMDYRSLLAITTSLPFGAGTFVAANRPLQFEFTQFSRKYAELNQLFRTVYSTDISPTILGAILTHKGPGRSPLEQRLLLRQIEKVAASRYSVDVAASQPKFDQLEFLITMSAPKDEPPRSIETSLNVTLPGGRAAPKLKLAPLRGTEGRSVLQAFLEVPIEVLASGGTIRYDASVSFDGVAQDASGSLELQTLVNLSHPLAMPESEDHDTFEFTTVLYHHAGFRPSSSNVKTVLEIIPLRRADASADDERMPEQIEGYFSFEKKWGDSLALVKKLAKFDDADRWPPGEYTCAFVFAFGDKQLRTPPTSFIIPEPTEVDEDPDAEEESDDPPELTDPTGPLRQAAARAERLSSQIAELLSNAHQLVAEGKASLTLANDSLKETERLIEDLAERIAQFQQDLPGLRQSTLQLEGIVEKVIDAKQAAKHAADRACDFADQAKSAKTVEDQRKFIRLSEEEYQSARRLLDAASKNLVQALTMTAQLKTSFEMLQSLNEDLGLVSGGLATAAEHIEDTAAKLAEADELLTLMQEKVAKLTSLKSQAAGMLSKGRAQVAPFLDQPLAQTYLKTMENLYGNIVATADRSQGFPDALDVFLAAAESELETTREFFNSLSEAANLLTVPELGVLDDLLDSTFSVDVAEIWLLKADEEVRRAFGCSQSAKDAPLPDGQLDGLTGNELTRIEPIPDPEPDGDLSGLDGSPLTRIPRTPTATPRTMTPRTPRTTTPITPRTTTPTTPRTPPESQMEQEEHTYALYVITDPETNQQNLFPFQLKLKPTGEKTATATLFMPGTPGAAEKAQLAQLGLSSSMPLSAEWSEGRYVIQGPGLTRFAKVGAVIGIGIGEAFGDSLANAMSLGLFNDDDQNDQRPASIAVKKAVVYATPNGNNLTLVSHAEVTVSLPNKPRKEIKVDTNLIGKRLN